MNRSLASFLFTGETLFHLKAEVQAPEPALKKKPVRATLVLVERLPEDQRDLLAKIMGSVGVPFHELDVVERQQMGDYDFSDLTAVRYILQFGPFPSVLAITQQTPAYQPTAANGIKLLYADALDTIAQNLHQEKRNLWNALKEMFTLN